MATDKNLFLYELAIVAIMKNEGRYVAEWIDYYLLAGADHFYIYDNDSSDNLREVLQPYVERGLVTYHFYPGTGRQCEAYNEAVQNYRFFCRYMAFIDADEFIFPKSDRSIVEVADEILADAPYAAGFAMNWMMYGSNNLERADYSRGVLDRFTLRAANLDRKNVKTIANPRTINYMFTPHYTVCFEGLIELNDSFLPAERKISDRIVVNHYKLKSREEFSARGNSGMICVAYGAKNYYDTNSFSHERDNDVFDDGILRYRDARQNRQNGGGGSAFGQINYPRLCNALLRSLTPVMTKNFQPMIFSGKMETFLICVKLAEYLRETMLDKSAGDFFEESALNAVHKTLFTRNSLADVRLLLSDLPHILALNYPVVEDIRKACIELIRQVKNAIRARIDSTPKMHLWRDFTEFDYLMKILETFAGRGSR